MLNLVISVATGMDQGKGGGEVLAKPFKLVLIGKVKYLE